MQRTKVCPLKTSEIVDKVIGIGEHISDTKLHPYQRSFARQIVLSVLTKDKRTITALFSRQCRVPGTLTLTPTGFVPIENLSPGDKLISVAADDRRSPKLDAVEDRWETEEQPLFDVWVDSGIKMQCGQGHQMMSIEDRWLSPADGLKPGSRIFSPLFPIVENPSGHTESRSSLVYLLGNSLTPSGPLEELLGAVNELRATSKRGSEILKEVFEQEPLEYGKYRSVELSDSTFKFIDMMKDSATFLKVLCRDAEVRRKKSKRGYPKLDIFCRIDSQGEALKQCLAVLRALGLDPIHDPLHSRVRFCGYQSILLLEPFLRDHFMHQAVLEVLNEEKVWGCSTIHRDDWIRAKRQCPKLEDFVRSNYSVNVSSKYAKQGIPFATFIRIVRYVCPELETQLLPKRHYRRVSGMRKKGYGKLIDITTGTGRYLTEEGLQHNCGKSEALAICTIGMIIGLPSLYRAYPGDSRFVRFKKGVWIGIFTPSRRQGKSLFDRIRNRPKEERGRVLFEQQRLEYVVDQTEVFSLSNGSKVSRFPCKEDSDIEAETFHLVIGDEAQDISGFKWKKSVVPMTTMTGGAKVLVGTANTKKSNFYDQIERNKERDPEIHFEVDYTIPSKYIPEYRDSILQEKIDMGEDSDEFRMAYKNEFIFERGMMLDPAYFELSKHNGKGFVHPALDVVDVYLGNNPVAVGIDVGRSVDSTVATAVEVLVDKPIEIEIAGKKNTLYLYRVINWLEIIGDDFDAQVPKLVMFIHRVRASRVVVDSTSLGIDMFDRLKKALPSLNIDGFNFNEKSKSELYKALLTVVKSGRLQVPGGEMALRTPELAKFLNQGKAMEKTWRESYLKCAAPKKKGAHDDFWDSLGLAIEGAKKLTPTKVAKVHKSTGIMKNRRRRNGRLGRRLR